MKELIIDYIPAGDANVAQVEVSYRPEPGMEQKSGRIDFPFEISGDDRRLIQWYMEEYLLYPYAAFVDRAKKAEESIQQKGEGLFDAVFSDRKAFAFYKEIDKDLADIEAQLEAAPPLRN